MINKLLYLKNKLKPPKVSCVNINTKYQETIARVEEQIISLLGMSDEEIFELCKYEIENFEKYCPTLSASHPLTIKLNDIINEYPYFNDKKITAQVYKGDDFNAFSYPNGTIKISSGIMESFYHNEILFIIGHELAHIVNGDAKRDLTYAKIAFYLGKLKNLALKTNHVLAPKNIIGFIGCLGIDIVSDGIFNLTSNSLAMYLSREHEFAADQFGLSLLNEIKEDQNSLNSAISALKKLEEYNKIDSDDGQNFLKYIFETHPPVSNRIAALKEYSLQQQKLKKE